MKKQWKQVYVGPHTKAFATKLAQGIMVVVKSSSDPYLTIEAMKIRKLPKQRNKYRIYALMEW